LIPAIILTAGLGSRLDPLTRLVAKPAVPLGNSTLVEHVLAWLRSAGVSDVVLNLHHRPETITSVLGDDTHLGMRIRYSWEDPILGSAGGPARAFTLLETDRALIVNGDTLCALDITPLLACHQRTGASVTLAVIPNPAPDHYNGLVLDDEDRVRGRIPKGRATAGTWHFVGVQVVDAVAFASLDPAAPADTIPGLYLDMAAEHPGSVRAWRVDTPFVDVGTPRDYLRTALTRARGDHAASITNCVVWPDARIEPGVTLDHCVVAGPVTLTSGFAAERAVIVPAAVLRPGDPITAAGDVAVFPLR
jgi:NDP-sugar pyrophosphorylase family protein